MTVTQFAGMRRGLLFSAYSAGLVALNGHVLREWARLSLTDGTASHLIVVPIVAAFMLYQRRHAVVAVARFNIGAAIGAGAGAISGRLTDIGIDDKFMKQAAGALTPGQAALCVLVRKVTADKVLPAMATFGGKVLHTNLTTEQETKLQDALKA